MGYNTDFRGSVSITPKLNQEEITYLKKFNASRRMDRLKGPYFVDGVHDFGPDKDQDIQDSNYPPEGQPGLWCGWVPTDDGTEIVWDEQEKFYDATEWMEYLILHFLRPNPIAKFMHPDEFSFLQGHNLNGEFDAQGEDPEDRWKLIVTDNIVTTKKAKIVWE